MIKRLSLKNFGPYESASINFDRSNVIIGANGSGKSMIFSALRSIGRVARFPLRPTKKTPSPGGYPSRTGTVSLDELLHRGETSRTMVLAADFETADLRGTYEIELGHWHGPAGTIVSERLEIDAHGGQERINAHPDGTVESTIKLPASRLRTPRFETIPFVLFHSREHELLGRQIQDAFWSNLGVFRLDPTALKTPAEVGRKFSQTGYNFASYLDEIRNRPGGKENFDALLARFREICPHVEDVLLPFDASIPLDVGGNDAGLQPFPARKRIALQIAASKNVIPADLESDGTILLLAYASLLHGSRPYETLCIEEPENGIYPKAIPQLISMLSSLTEPRESAPGAQVIICSHSAKVLEASSRRPEVVRLVRRGTDGRATVIEPTPAQFPSLAGWAGLA